ncbi:MAG TPA: hypothetical protein VD997_00700 [Phycisphaerales bacterium]|nr:hypothetical protein [Phycisphaerales bacterium]
MSTARIQLLVGAALMAGIGYWGFHSIYAAPRRDLQEQIDQTSANIDTMKRTLRAQVELHDRAKALRTATLGGKQDQVEHRFRTGLSRLGEQEGLTKVVVDHGQPQSTTSPLLSTKGIPTPLKQNIRKQPDFQTIRGTLKGIGTLEEVCKVVATAQSQSWLHRVDGFSIKPVGGERNQFELKLDVATLYLPDLPGGDGPEPVIVQPPAVNEPLWRAVASKNVFKAPPAPAPGVEPVRPVEVAQAPATPQPAPPPQVFAPYDDWKLTGVIISGERSEALFFNTRTLAKLTVEEGAQILDAVFVEGLGEKAVIEIAGKRFEVSNGQTLAARKPV